MNGKPTDEADPPEDGDTRTPAWYQTRTLLALAIDALLVTAVLFVPSFMGVLSDPPQLWQDLIPWAGFLGVLLGLAWMIRSFRGPRDEPPPWRYRDR
jgi:hypothetical protein